MRVFPDVLAALCICDLCLPVASQQTIVVDSLMRPGAHFAAVTQGLWAARSGDKIQIRSAPQAYHENCGVFKAVTIEGIDAGWGRPFVNTLAIQVGYLTTREQVICRNVDCQAFVAMDCSGLVHFEDCGSRSRYSNFTIWQIKRCAQVSLVRCKASGADGWPGVWADGSHVTLNRCELWGADAVAGPPKSGSSEALRVVHGTAALNQCVLSGGSGHPLTFDPPSAGITATSSRLIVAGDENSVIASGTSLLLSPIMGTAVTLDLDPRVLVTASDGTPLPPQASIVVRRHAICRVEASMVPHAGMRDLVVSVGGGEPGLAVLLLGLPDIPLPVANGYWYLGASPADPVMVLRTSPERIATWRTAIPSANVWGGYRVAFQTVTLGNRVEPGSVIHVAL